MCNKSQTSQIFWIQMKLKWKNKTNQFQIYWIQYISIIFKGNMKNCFETVDLMDKETEELWNEMKLLSIKVKRDCKRSKNWRKQAVVYGDIVELCAVFCSDCIFQRIFCPVLYGVIVLILVQFMLYDDEILHSLVPEKMKIMMMIWVK